MDDLVFFNSDLEKFAEHLGLNGIDADVFYETYYQLNTDDVDSETVDAYTEEEYLNT